MFGVERMRLRRILLLALPIIGGMVSQNLLNLVDTVMVSRLGAAALAAVGLASFANFVATAFLTGMAAGVQAVAARRKGQGRDAETAVPLNGGLIAVAAIGIPLAVLLFVLAPRIFSLLSTDPEVAELGVPYLRARLVAIVAAGMNFSFRGYWNGVGLSRLYLRTLVIMHACNVFLNFALIFGYFGAPALGVTGAGIGTAASTFLGTGIYFYLGMTHAREGGFLAAIPRFAVMKDLFKLSAPSGLQQLFVALGLTSLFAIIDRIGTAEVAAANVLMNLSLIAYLPGLGLGLAAASLVGQALGRGDAGDAARWGWDVARIGTVILGALGMPLLLFPELILGAFFADEPEALALAATPLRLVGATIAIEGIGLVLLNSVMGAGATKLAMFVVTGMQWLLLLPLAYLVGPVLGAGLLGVWLVHIGYRLALAGTFILIWRSRAWARAKV